VGEFRVKCYVSVEVYYTSAGQLIPLSVEWEDGRVFHIDRAEEPEPAVSRTGSCGERYACSIHGVKTFLYYEDPAWFVEKKTGRKSGQ
jgi:hypothetical protein